MKELQCVRQASKILASIHLAHQECHDARHIAFAIKLVCEKIKAIVQSAWTQQQTYSMSWSLCGREFRVFYRVSQVCDLKQSVQAHWTNSRAMPLFPNIIFPSNRQQSQTSFPPVQRILSPRARACDPNNLNISTHTAWIQATHVHSSSHCAETYILDHLRLQHNQQPHERPNRG